MPPRNETKYKIDELAARVTQLEEIAKEMRHTIELANRFGLTELSSTHGDQFRRALEYLVKFAGASKRAVITAIPGRQSGEEGGAPPPGV